MARQLVTVASSSFQNFRKIVDKNEEEKDY